MPKLVRNRLVLAVRDLALSTSYWIDQLGFHREFGDGSDGWSFLARDEFSVMLGECPDEVAASETGNHSYVAYITVEDIDGLYTDLTSRGAMISSTPANKRGACESSDSYPRWSSHAVRFSDADIAINPPCGLARNEPLLATRRLSRCCLDSRLSTGSRTAR